VIFLKLSWEIRDKLEIYDLRSAKASYNLALAYRNLGNYFKLEEYSSLSVKGYIKVLGDSTTELLDPYSALCGAYIELQETAKAIDISNKALVIAEKNIRDINPGKIADIYSNLGVCYIRMADFSKAKIFSEKSENICKSNNLIFDDNYLNLINSLAIVYDGLGLKDKSFEYYQKGVTLAKTFPETTSFTLNIINSFAINLADSGKNEKAEELYTFIISKAAKSKTENPQLYYEVLNNYAEFLREYNKQNDSVIYAKSLDYNAQCMKYLLDNPEDHRLMDPIYIGYSLSLSKSGDPVKAVKYIQDLITEKYKMQNPDLTFGNPALSDIKPNKLSLKIFKAKYNILWNIYTKTNDKEALEASAGTSEIVISLLEKIRINISEEESRLLLGDKYRDLYFNAINSFMQLYKDTSDKVYLEKAFEYAEKSKVAGLLSATRELKASQFQIPVDLADLEFRIKSNLSALNEMISENTNKEKPNNELMQELNDKVIRITLSRDSLISVFEQKFPGYYSIKYNTRVALLENIPEIVGRNGNYVNYVMSDSLIYIFVANRKFSHLTSVKIDSLFYDQIKQFRSLLLMPGSSEDAAAAFFKYQTMGYELYKKLIDPVRHYLISEKVIISPDNYLSYIPFETLPVNEVSETTLKYRSIHYLMEDFDISYTYSATFMSESVSSGINYSNTTISFAPDYPNPIDVNAILMSRQEDHGILSDLPFARMEAEYVSEITNGLLYENTYAKESVFKNSAGDYDIIHLAMHTLMNDKDPMRSTLIFSPEKDSLNDGYLKTFEVYGLPLKAKMVVLSSCNTGNGFLSTGEGILSLARGFIYSGSKSVVMSMWEIEDRSGTEIVKMFYSNLKRGYSKSESLRRARISYLKNSDQLRSHPYFWSALVVYGDNSPLYFSRYLIAGLTVIGIILSVLITLYLRKRRYS
jgi:CHAT domain-containing protein/Tfp pilus assembly protein PilF